MWRRGYFLLIATIAAVLQINNGCTIEGVTNWLVPVSRSILDTDRGTFFSSAVTNVAGISTSFGEGLNQGPYVVAVHNTTSSTLDISTNDAYEYYEVYETALTMTVTIQFSCTTGTPRTLVLIINVIDTNNHPPTFKLDEDEEEFVFTLLPPVPPGFQITGCLNDIIVKDIDLTTQRIEFDIEDNEYFEIAYDSDSSNTAKEFNAILRTTTLIRSIPEPIRVTIRATDVDLTGDPPITSSTTIQIQGDTEFQLPEEPIFSQPFYLASYTNSDQISLQDPISLQQGYHEEVKFDLEGEYRDYFDLDQNENQLTLVVTATLPPEVFNDGQTFLVVRAERNFTSGATATIVVQLPEVEKLKFENTVYEGSIVDNTLEPLQLTLTQGYQESFTVRVIHEYSLYFEAQVVNNIVTLTMLPLTTNIINGNSFINLEVEAASNYSLATAVVSLQIIKDDNDTPAFERTIYIGSYAPDIGLTLEQIILVQGYDETVSLSLDGEFSDYFEWTRNGSSITLVSNYSLPLEVLSEQYILLTLSATKPRTVAANAVVTINLPQARELKFEENIYTGVLNSIDVTLSLEAISLSVGYESTVNFALTGYYSNYFILTNNQNEVTVQLSSIALPENVVTENNFLTFILTASDDHAITTSTTILIEILKEDSIAPLFSQHIYFGSYSDTNGVDIESNIALSQGYDSDVSFELSGVHAQHFDFIQNGTNVVLIVRTSIPTELIFDEKVLIFNILAIKNMTVGANAAIAIQFPQELTDAEVMKFSQNTFIGYIENDSLSLDDIILEAGFANGTEFRIIGDSDLTTYFRLEAVYNAVTIELINTIPSEVLDEHKFIILEIEASRDRAISDTTSVVIEVVKQEVVRPVFSEAYYRGVYSEDTGLIFNTNIYLTQGFDESVRFTLEGDSSEWFAVIQSEEYLNIVLNGTIPEDILEISNHLVFNIVALNSETTGRAAIIIDLPKETTDSVILRFSRNSYVASIEDGELQVPALEILGDNLQPIQINITGEYSQYFNYTQDSNNVNIQLLGALPENVLIENTFLTLEIGASYPNAISAYTTVIIEIIRDPRMVTPVFDQPYYVGEYSVEIGLQFEQLIQLTQGLDDSVVFTLEGVDANWFSIQRYDNNSIAVILNATEIERNEERSYLLFSIIAEKPNVENGKAAIIIALTDESEYSILQFDRNSYTGSIANNTVTLDQITLVEGYSQNVTFALFGELAPHFDFTQDGASITVFLRADVSEEWSSSDRLAVIEVRATAPAALSAAATLVFEIKTDEAPSVDHLLFEEPYYSGQYSQEGLVFETPVALAQGYDENVQFSLREEDTEWIELIVNENSVTLNITSEIPTEILVNNQQIILVITAEKPGAVSVTAPIVIELISDGVEFSILQFDRNSYTGSIANNTVTLDQITLVEGYSQNVTFALFGELAPHFDFTQDGASITVFLRADVSEEWSSSDRLAVIEVRATAPVALSAAATLVFEIKTDEAPSVDHLLFEEPYYSGQYSQEGLVFETPVALAQGYDENVQFSLREEDTEWIELIVNENSVTLNITSEIPTEILVNNQQIILVITAEKPGAVSVTAPIVIELISDGVEFSILQFDRNSYTGSIANNTVTLDQITLVEGYSQNVTFALFGELAPHFDFTQDGASITVFLRADVSEEWSSSDRLAVIEVRATAPAALSAAATLVFEIKTDETSSVDHLLFDSPYYSGQYSQEGLVFETPVALAQGYDENVQFSLSEGDTEWIELIVNENSVTLNITSEIPSEVLVNNQQIILVIMAEKPGAVSVTAPIVIELISDGVEFSILQFNRNSYTGSIANNTVTLDQIILVEGYSQNVTFALFGELAPHFDFTQDGASITVFLRADVSEEWSSSDRLAVIEVRATAPAALSAAATLVFEIKTDEAPSVDHLLFEEPYYSGQYSQEGLVFETPVALAQGYDENVQFSLREEDTEWIELIVNENSVTLNITSEIPTEILVNNQQIILVITAEKPGAVSVTAPIVIELISDGVEFSILQFDRNSYTGSIANNTVTLDQITLVEGYSQNVTFALFGELAPHFDFTQDGASITVFLRADVSEEWSSSDRLAVIEVRATAPVALSAAATLVFEIKTDETSSVDHLLFDSPYYSGQYSQEGLVFETPVALAQGYDENVQFSLREGDTEWIELIVNENSVTLNITSEIPSEVLVNNQQIILVITAEKPGAVSVTAPIVIELISDGVEFSILQFDRNSYTGSIANNTVTLDQITLVEGYSQNVTFALFGELAPHFDFTQDGASITVFLRADVSEEWSSSDRLAVIEVRATAPAALSAATTLVFEIKTDEAPSVDHLLFEEPYYTGQYSEESITFENAIVLSQGYDESVSYKLDGENSVWFNLNIGNNSVSLLLDSPIPPSTIVSNQKLLFSIRAEKPDSIAARAAIIITLTDDLETLEVLGFNRINYQGSIDNVLVDLEPVILSEGYTGDVSFSISQEVGDYINIVSSGNIVTFDLPNALPADIVPTNRIIVIELMATAPDKVPAYATVVFHVKQEENVELAFENPYHVGSYSHEEGFVFENPIILIQGYDESVQYRLDGDIYEIFSLEVTGNSIELLLDNSIPDEVLDANSKLILSIFAERSDNSSARVILIISLANDIAGNPDVAFDKVLFMGIVQSGLVEHERVTISGFNGTDIQLRGEFAELFEASVIDSVITVRGKETIVLSSNIPYVPLELIASSASAVLLLDINHSDENPLPSVTFSSSSYVIRADVNQISLLGRVEASAENGEDLSYSLQVDNAHLQQRIFINNEGELRLSAPADSGVYSFQVIATTAFTQATGSADVHLTVDAITVCDNDIVVPPLIIIDRDEELPYSNLVTTEHEGCQYTMSNRWPLDQSWLYVDENGLHTTAIDREHESIAFMALSQVQVELILECNNDTSRTKRSIDTENRLDWLGPYDYGNNKWILTDTISYNSRRTLVNLIVNDINDNYPIFVGKENEPIVVGYPIPELEDRVLPRALIELQATDADVGENAALRYWTSENALAVSPTTGVVHVRRNALLQDSAQYSVHVTDRNGEGLTGSLLLEVKLLDLTNIAVVTINDAFLDDETEILRQLTTAVGYEVKTLRAVIISDITDEESGEMYNRKTRDTINSGATLQLHVYGLIEREPVEVDQLTFDINNNLATGIPIAGSISLGDYLENLCHVRRDLGLLVATIVLSVLLFILIVAIAVWFFLLWRKKKKYGQFYDEDSLKSRNDSFGTLPKPDPLAKPRLNIEELRKSERRLQEMLEIPVEVIVPPTTSRWEPPMPSKLSSVPEPLPDNPFVIQSIDKLKDADDSDEDEFGEKVKSRRKSVVTFNENVEKIIHVDDTADDISEYEVFKF